MFEVGRIGEPFFDDLDRPIKIGSGAGPVNQTGLVLIVGTEVDHARRWSALGFVLIVATALHSPGSSRYFAASFSTTILLASACGNIGSRGGSIDEPTPPTSLRHTMLPSALTPLQFAGPTASDEKVFCAYTTAAQFIPPALSHAVLAIPAASKEFEYPLRLAKMTGRNRIGDCSMRGLGFGRTDRVGGQCQDCAAEQ